MTIEARSALKARHAAAIKCPWCGRKVNVNSAGKIAIHHTRNVVAGGMRQLCPGVGKDMR